jgi:hypothetical protein
VGSFYVHVIFECTHDLSLAQISGSGIDGSKFYSVPKINTKSITKCLFSGTSAISEFKKWQFKKEVCYLCNPTVLTLS